MKSSPNCVCMCECMHKSRAFITLHRLSREENEIKGEVRVDPSQGVHRVHLPLLPDCYPARRGATKCLLPSSASALQTRGDSPCKIVSVGRRGLSLSIKRWIWDIFRKACILYVWLKRQKNMSAKRMFGFVFVRLWGYEKQSCGKKIISWDQQDGAMAQCQHERVSWEPFVDLIHMFLRFVKQKLLDFYYHIKLHTFNSSPRLVPFCIAALIFIFSFQTVSLHVSGGDF